MFVKLNIDASMLGQLILCPAPVYKSEAEFPRSSSVPTLLINSYDLLALLQKIMLLYCHALILWNKEIVV